ncbi:hypothetical protein [Adlercreutzia caecimuris]|uniref:hypothetical protein n=1 Tax=Adlercreutzia caecimuris TaxID=671266 RepID=UPI0024943854|nr:hypothetical protein [Adlercreutzia caecimuris]
MKNVTTRKAAPFMAAALVAALAAGSLAGCAGASGGATSMASTDPVTMTTKTLVKTATNEMTLVDWDVTADESPLTISSDDARFADYLASLEELTGFDIENITMQVTITEFAGAEIAATHENVTDNMYRIDALEAVVDGQSITYAEGDFK